jgi:hypothetical protein
MSHQATKYHGNIGTGVSFGLDEALGRFVIQAGVGWGHCESGDAVLEIMVEVAWKYTNPYLARHWFVFTRGRQVG